MCERESVDEALRNSSQLLSAASLLTHVLHSRLICLHAQITGTTVTSLRRRRSEWQRQPRSLEKKHLHPPSRKWCRHGCR